jgi:hypothetical protein
MTQPLTVHGRYAGRTFIPDGPLPDAEGTAELVITPNQPQPRGSVADVFGSAPVLRSGNDILAQVRAERDEWGEVPFGNRLEFMAAGDGFSERMQLLLSDVRPGTEQ